MEERRSPHDCKQEEIIMRHDGELKVMLDFKDRTERLFSQISGSFIANIVMIVLLGSMFGFIIWKLR